jgi:hypothetical protein
MPDLQSELNKINSAIAAWEAPAETTRHGFTVTNNVSRATFEYVRDNPGVHRGGVVAALSAQGFNSKSTSSLLTQMVAHAMLRSDNGALYAVATEYAPLKRRPRDKRPVPTAKAAKTPKHVDPTPAPAPAPALASPLEILSTLRVLEAKALYDELRKIFGG